MNKKPLDLFLRTTSRDIDKLRQNEDVVVMGDLNGHVEQRTEGYNRASWNR